MAALLTIGGAILLLSCGDSKSEDVPVAETLMTQRAENLIIIESKQGRKKNRFGTPLVEGYDYAKEPYKEFRKGVNIVTYADSTERVESTLVANYAIFFEKRELWEAKGNVVVTNAEGDVLETQQLFWNQRTAKIYSNIDSKITRGDDVMVGVGFESDEAFKDWEFRRPRGKGAVEVDLEGSDSTATSAPAAIKTVQPVVGSAPNIDATPTPTTQKPKTARTDSSRVTREVAPADLEATIDKERRDKMESIRSRGEPVDSASTHRGVRVR